MKKYLINGLTLLTSAMICVQAPVSVLAKNITDTQSETYSLAVQAEDYGIDSHTFDSTTVNDQIEEQVKSLYR